MPTRAFPPRLLSDCDRSVLSHKSNSAISRKLSSASTALWPPRQVTTISCSSASKPRLGPHTHMCSLSLSLGLSFSLKLSANGPEDRWRSCENKRALSLSLFLCVRLASVTSSSETKILAPPLPCNSRVMSGGPPSHTKNKYCASTFDSCRRGRYARTQWRTTESGDARESLSLSLLQIPANEWFPFRLYLANEFGLLDRSTPDGELRAFALRIHCRLVVLESSLGAGQPQRATVRTWRA